jgi:hypothetical protein
MGESLMRAKKIYAIIGLMLAAQFSMAGTVTLPVVGLGIGPLSAEIGGVAAIAAVSFIIGAQLIRRRK